jgi:sugar lactone lactonase YvrE
VWVSAVSGRVQQFSGGGKYLRGLGGGQGRKPGQFLAPHGLAVDSRGHLYVVDSYNHRVQKFDVSR